MCKQALLLLLPLAALGSAPLAVALPTNFILVMADGEFAARVLAARRWRRRSVPLCH
eukprot:SAG22_NODE_2511_length_2491_cov_1.441890_4_plen_57_part_00